MRTWFAPLLFSIAVLAVSLACWLAAPPMSLLDASHFPSRIKPLP